MTKVKYSELDESQSQIMALGEDAQKRTHVKATKSVYHDVGDVEQILDCVRKDGCRYYKIRWKDSWESEECLGGFHHFVKEFWDKVEESRRQPRHHFHHPMYQSKRHSPPTNGSESPLHTEESHQPRLYRHVSDISQQNGDEEERELTPDDSRVMTSSPPSLSTGRRKGKPKKLVNHISRSPSPPIHINGIHSPTLREYEPYLKRPSQDSRESSLLNEHLANKRHSLPGAEKDLLTVEIPKNTAAESPRSPGNLEEYPVMIIGENCEESVLIKESRKNVASPRHVQKSDAKHPYVSPRPDIFRSSPSNEGAHVHLVNHTPPNTSPEDNADSHKHPHAPPLTPVYQNATFQTIPHHHHVISQYSPEKYQHANLRPVIYHTRALPHRKSGHIVNPHYIYADQRHPIDIEKSREKISDAGKLETSQLLLKVTAPPVPSTTNITSLSTEQRHKLTVYQNNTTPNVGPSPKKRPKVGSVKGGRKTPTKYLTTADGEQRPQCAECFQTFKKRAALERHMMIHRGIKPFQCHFCNQRFRQKHHLQGHIMLHTGERPHSCTMCNKRFRMRHHLLEHERISHKVFR